MRTRFYRFVLATLIGAASLGLGGPAAAQLDLSGEWGAIFHEDLPHRGGMRLGDYTGLPLNEAGYLRAATWDEAMRSIPEWQCIPHVVTYALRGPATIRFSKIVDERSGDLIGYRLVGSYGRPRTIWMDGRPHPSGLAPHTWAGFSTGPLGAQRARRLDDAHQDGLAATQRLPDERPRDDDRVLHALRRASAARELHQRPRVSRRTVHPHHELRRKPHRERQCVGHLLAGGDRRRAAGPAKALRAALPAG